MHECVRTRLNMLMDSIKLDARHQRFVLLYLEGKTLKEIGELENISAERVRQRLCIAYRMAYRRVSAPPLECTNKIDKLESYNAMLEKIILELSCMKMPTVEFDNVLSTRTRNLLKRNGIFKNIQLIIAYKKDTLKDIHGMGVGLIDEIEDFLKIWE